VSAPYKLAGLNVAFRQGRCDARAGRPAKRTNDMSTFYAAAYLRGYKGQDYRRGSDGHLVFSGGASLGVRKMA
jgi:hypothetical protein